MAAEWDVGLAKNKPVIKKIHFDICTSTGSNKTFRKYVYSKADDEQPQYVVVQYLSDASSAKNYPHGACS